jgi:hypothetical protein
MQITTRLEPPIEAHRERQAFTIWQNPCFGVRTLPELWLAAD